MTQNKKSTEQLMVDKFLANPAKCIMAIFEEFSKCENDGNVEKEQKQGPSNREVKKTITQMDMKKFRSLSEENLMKSLKTDLEFFQDDQFAKCAKQSFGHGLAVCAAKFNRPVQDILNELKK